MRVTFRSFHVHSFVWFPFVNWWCGAEAYNSIISVFFVFLGPPGRGIWFHMIEFLLSNLLNRMVRPQEVLGVQREGVESIADAKPCLLRWNRSRCVDEETKKFENEKHWSVAIHENQQSIVILPAVDQMLNRPRSGAKQTQTIICTFEILFSMTLSATKQKLLVISAQYFDYW